MKKGKTIGLLFALIMTFGVVMARSNSNDVQETKWEDVKVVYDLSEVADQSNGKKMTETIRTSLNFGTKSKVKRDCLKELKKQAAKNGYSILYIDEEASSDKRFNKRGIEVTLVGRGYKG